MRKLAQAVFLMCIIHLSFGAEDGKPEEISRDDVAILIMGDTQYPFICETPNVPCKKAGEADTENDREKAESLYSNEVQRKAMESFISMQGYRPAGLVIDGDLTAYGHGWQLKGFKKLWTDVLFPIPIYPGLGNHDYQNNMNDCHNNVCVRNMIGWFLDFAKERTLPLDVQLTVNKNFLASFSKGSLAYTEKLCSYSLANCVHLVQMHNSIDYEVTFKTTWSLVPENYTIESGIPWLKRQLELWRDDSSPILINFHQNNKEALLIEILGDWIATLPTKNRKIGVFFAHIHAEHQVKTVCIHGVPVPFVTVGSVPNNRFTVFRYGGEAGGIHISGYAARERGPVLLESFADLWEGECKPSTHVFRNVD